jgi:3-oxoadipate enol-lactonase
VNARINGFDMHYEVAGEGTPVLFVHGYPFDGSMWQPQVEALSDGARLIMPDLRGCGRSTATPPPYSMDLYADDLKGLLDHLGIERAVLAGLSMGGYISFAFYRKYADRVQALALLDTRPQADSPEARENRKKAAETARNEGAAAIAKGLIPKLFSPKTLESQSPVVDQVRQMMERQEVEGIVGALTAMMDRPDSTPTLAQITCPTLIVVGADDVLTPPDASRQMHEAIQGSQLEIIPDAGHLSTMEQPDRVNRILGNWLRGMGD